MFTFFEKQPLQKWCNFKLMHPLFIFGDAQKTIFGTDLAAGEPKKIICLEKKPLFLMHHTNYR